MCQSASGFRATTLERLNGIYEILWVDIHVDITLVKVDFEMGMFWKQESTVGDRQHVVS